MAGHVSLTDRDLANKHASGGTITELLPAGLTHHQHLLLHHLYIESDSSVLNLYTLAYLSASSHTPPFP